MKPLLTILMIGISVGFGQIDSKDITVDSLDSLSLRIIGAGLKVKFCTITDLEVEGAKKEAIRFLNNLPKNRLKLDLKFEEYTKQYIGFTDEDGNEYIYINGFCVESDGVDNLKTNLIFHLDGGNCFFQMKISVKTGKCIDFQTNGVA